MESNILLSIAIPTYNRYQYLEDCLKATCTIKSERMEIIVQDNTEDNAKGVEIVRRINDERVKYFYTKEHITVSENCSAAIENARGKYVCLLGDDDTVCDNIIDLVEEMQRQGVDTCVFGISIYHWADLLNQVPSLNCFEGVERTGIVTNVNPIDILRKSLKEGLQSISELPRVYHAIASKEVLNKIKELTGTYFPGPSPDMANAMGCALFSKNHVHVDIPVMISGYGGTSTGGMGRKRQHRGSLQDKPWLPKNILEIWDKKIPRLWLGHTIWPASAITAFRALGREDLVEKINYGVIYAEVLMHEKSCIKEIVTCHVSFAEFFEMFLHIVRRVVVRVIKKDKRKQEVLSRDAISLIEAKRLQDKENSKFPISEAFRKCRNK